MTQPTKIDKFGTTWFQKSSNGVSPLKICMDNANKTGNKFIYAYQAERDNYIYGGYKSQTDFIEQLMMADKTDRRFHEVLCGHCKTYADIEWTDMSIDKETIKNNMESILRFLFIEIAGDSDIRFWWSDSSGLTKGSLHLVVEAGSKVWRNTTEQKVFWDIVKAFIDHKSDDYIGLFYMKPDVSGLLRTCVIDFGVYTKNRQFRTVQSHKIGSDRYLKPAYKSFIDKYLVSVSANIMTEFYEIPDKLKSMFAVKEYNSVINIDENIYEIITANISDAIISEINGCLIKMKTIGCRKCIINGEDNLTDNCFCVIKHDGIYFYCHDAGCSGKSKKIYSFENKQILPDYIRDFNDYTKLNTIENLSMDHIREFVNQNLVYITNNMNGFYMFKNIEYGNIVYKNEKTINDAVFKVQIQGEPKKCVLKKIIESMRYDNCKKSIDFRPYNELIPHEKNMCVDENIFNLFQGFQANIFANPTYEIEYDYINPVLNHIKEIWCKNIDVHFEYIINWMAHIVQKPAIKTGVAIFLKSTKQGAGKDIIWQFISDYVIGKTLTGHLNDIEQLTNKFNNSLCFKLLTICDELPTFTVNKCNADKLKNLITQPVVRLEQKSVDAITVNDFNNYVLLSNNDYAIHVEPGDRRYFPLELDNKYAGNTAYFNNISRTCFNKKAGDVFYNYLMRRDLSEYSPQNITQTELKRELKTYSMPRSLAYIEYIYKENDPLSERYSIHKDELFSAFTLWSAAEGYKSAGYNAKRFTTELKLINIEFKKVRIDKILKIGTLLNKEEILTGFKSYLRDDDYTFDCDGDIIHGDGPDDEFDGGEDF